METKRLQAFRGVGVDQLQVRIGVTTTTATNTTFTATGSFERPFEAAPLVIGSNVEGAAGAGASVAVTPTGIEVYLRANSPTVFSAGTTYVTVTLEGRVA